MFAEIQTVAANQAIGAGGWALAYLGVGDQARALEQPEFAAVRAQLTGD